MKSATTKESDMQATEIEMGSRWQLKHDVDRYPHFIAKAGMIGTVTDTYDSHVSLRMDEKIDGAEEWDNEIVWSFDNGEDFTADCRPA